MCSVGYTSTSALFCAQTDVSHEKDRSARVNNSLCTRHVRSLVCLSTRLFAGGESTCESQDYRGGIIRMFSRKKGFLFAVWVTQTLHNVLVLATPRYSTKVGKDYLCDITFVVRPSPVDDDDVVSCLTFRW